MKRLTFIILCLLGTFLVSCEEERYSEAAFVTDIKEISLSKDGKAVMEYDDKIHQLAFDERKCQFRLMDDSLSDYFIVTLSSIPDNLGDVVSGTIIYTTDDDIKTLQNIELKLAATQNASGGTLLWLWNDASATGVVVQRLR